MSYQVITFDWPDYLVFLLTLVVSTAIGIYYGCFGKKQSTTDLLLGGRSLHIIPVAMSLQASFLSAIFILGTATEIYLNGCIYVFIIIGYAFAAPITAHVFLPVFHHLQVTSAYEYLEVRFNVIVRRACSLSFCLMMILYLGIALYTPALAFAQVSNIPIWINIVLVGCICTFYTALGGLKAVVWTDAFQMLVILCGILSLIGMSLYEVGGFARVWSIAKDRGRLNFINFSPDPTVRHTFWSTTIGGGFVTMSLYCANQAMIQRYLSISKLKHAQVAVYIAMASNTFFLLLVVLLGLVMFAFYHSCDPLSSKAVSKPDQIVPLFVIQILGRIPALSGLFMSCIFCAALSTVSSGVNSLAAVLLEDFIRPMHLRSQGREIGERRAVIFCRFLACLFGISTIIIAFITEKIGKLVLQIALSVFGIVGGPLLGVFALGILCRYSNAHGSLAGLIFSLILAFWMKIGNMWYPTSSSYLPLSIENCSNLLNSSFRESLPQNYTSFNEIVWVPFFYRISYLWYTPILALTTVLVGLIVSALSKKTHKYSVSVPTEESLELEN